MHHGTRLAALLVLTSIFAGDLLAQPRLDDDGLPSPCGEECHRAAHESAQACRNADDPQACIREIHAKLRDCLEEAGCDVPPAPEPPCGVDCFHAAQDASRDCRDADDPRACSATVHENLRACLVDAGCDVPEPPPPPCGKDCFEGAHEALRGCQESDDPRACVIDIQEKLRACLVEAGCVDERPDQPERPEPCGSDCNRAAHEAFQDCRDSDDPRACARAVHEELRSCLTEAGCIPERPDPPERPQPCGADCYAGAHEAARACHESDDPHACVRAVHESLRDCLEESECVPDLPDPPERCGADCQMAAHAAAIDCRDADDPRACLLSVHQELRICLEEAGCNVPHRDAPERCGAGCRHDAAVAVRACLEEGGDRQECIALFHEAVQACRDVGSCEMDEETEENEEELDEQILAQIVGVTFGTFLRGDGNSDGGVDLSDAVSVLNWLFTGGSPPGCIAAANFNTDSAVDIADPAYLLNHLFLGGPAPVEPFPDCGTSNLEVDAELGCEESSCH